MNKEVQMNFKKIRGRIVITAGVLAMTVVPQAVSAACVQTQNAGGDQTAGVSGGVSVR